MSRSPDPPSAGSAGSVASAALDSPLRKANSRIPTPVLSAVSLGCLAMKLAMIGTLNGATKPHGTVRGPRFLGVFEGSGGLCSRFENR